MRCDWLKPFRPLRSQMGAGGSTCRAAHRNAVNEELRAAFVGVSPSARLQLVGVVETELVQRSHRSKSYKNQIKSY